MAVGPIFDYDSDGIADSATSMRSSRLGTFCYTVDATVVSCIEIAGTLTEINRSLPTTLPLWSAAIAGGPLQEVLRLSALNRQTPESCLSLFLTGRSQKTARYIPEMSHIKEHHF